MSDHPPPDRSPLTETELHFLIAAGIPLKAFSPEAAEANSQWEVRSAAAIAAAMSSWLTTKDVAALLGIEPAEVRRMRRCRELIAVTLDDESARYAPWQFTDQRTVLPGLHTIALTFPPDFHALDIEAIMTSPEEALGGSSPVEYLEAGGSANVVVELIDDLSRM